MKISRTKDVKLPNRGTNKSAGLDFFIPNDFVSTVLKPNDSIKILSGIKCKIPEGKVLIAFNKSGIALKGLSVGACVIDEDYQGEIGLHIFNHSTNDIQLNAGEKLMQFLLLPIFYEDIEEVEEKNLFESKTERGTGGFGSTGLN